METKTKTANHTTEEMKMDNNKLVKMAEKTTAIKSLKDLVRARTNENPVLLIDVSTSMDGIMRNGKSRIAGLREVVKGLQEKRPTQMIAFGLQQPPNPEAQFVQGGVNPPVSFNGMVEVGFVSEVPDAQGGTPMAEGIDYARQTGFGRAVVISDGAPNDRNRAMDAARQFGGRIDVIFVGDPGDPGSIMLEEMAKATGGQRFEGDLSEIKEITGAVMGLLNGEVLEEDDEDEDDDEEDDEDEDDEDGDDEDDE